MSETRIRVFSRPGCHLCEQLVEALLPLARGRAKVEILNIDSRKDWQIEYASRIPVVEVDGQFVCQYQLDTAAVTRALAAAKATMATS
jgi:hypothetical protein